jgi:hypothetical protein
MKYLTRFNPNLALVGLVALINRQSGYLNSGSLGQWTRDNDGLLNKMRGYIKIGG